MPKSVVTRIQKFNKGRRPDILKLKWKALKENPFRFFRGTCHLFYEDLPSKSFLLRSPNAWICGDLHLENFGTFKGENRVAYFDMNDFDEAILGPCLLDVARLCTSIFLMSTMLKINEAESRKLVRIFLRSYAENLSLGYIKSVEPETATGFIRKFLDSVRMRKRKDLLNEKVKRSGSKLLIRCDSVKAFKAKRKEKARVKKAVESWAMKNMSNPQFYKVIDVAVRTVGTGSLGIERYLVLTEGKGGPDGYCLLDVKQALPPTPLKYLRLRQPEWHNEADRVIGIQKRVQTESPAYLNSLHMGNQMFVLKELQPMEDKIDFTRLEKDMAKLNLLLKDMGAIVAWNTLRSSGRQGSVIADKWIRFGNKMGKLEKDIESYSEQYANRTIKYWREFVKKNPV